VKSVTYAYLGPDDEAAKFAKKGTASDITLFNAKKGDAHLNIVTPTRFPDKVTPLLYALDLADEVVLHPQNVDRHLGETIVACELLGKTSGYVRASENANAAQLRGLLAKTALKTLEVTEESEATFRERLYETAALSTDGACIVPVDHSFPVKGVGTVILGLVRSGEVKAHDALQAYPGPKKVDIRSIQVHDVDVKGAPTRSRVGLAVKNVEPQDVPRGTVLAAPGSLKVLPAGSSVTFDARLHPFSKWEPRAGAVLRLFHVLQDVVFRVTDVNPPASPTPKITGKLETPVAVVPDQPGVLVDLDNKVQRLVGSVAFGA